MKLLDKMKKVEENLLAEANEVTSENKKEIFAMENGFDSFAKMDASMVEKVASLKDFNDDFTAEEIEFLNKTPERIIACLKTMVMNYGDIVNPTKEHKKLLINLSCISLIFMEDADLDDYFQAVHKFFEVAGSGNGSHLSTYVLTKLREFALTKELITADYVLDVNMEWNEAIKEVIQREDDELPEIIKLFKFNR